jgi:hypothetical protein
MKKKCLILLTFILLLLCRQDVFAETILPTDVDTAGSGCTLLGIEGEYVVQIQDALDRINEIRYEACKEGVANPSGDGALTLSDYVPIKWSSDLEYIARIRAAESSLTMGHTRTNGSSCFNIESPNGVRSYGEVLAWNWSKNMVYAVNQWYSEKSDWVNSTGGVTGHYTQMIDPEHLYIGLGTFCTNSASYYSTTAGEYSSKNGLDETRGTATGTCIQTLEVQDSLLSGDYEIKASTTLSTGGDASSLRLTKSKLLILDTVNWSSSDNTVISVDGNGLASALRCGSATITAVDSAGHTASENFTINHVWSSWTTVTKATVFDAETQERTC